MAAILLRRASAVDAPRVAEIFLASRRAHVAFAPLAHADDDVRRWVATTLVAGGGVTVAERDGVLLGFVATAVDAEAGWIESLYLDPARVGQGLGSRLLRHALSGLVGSGKPVRLYTFAANVGARRFYERHGFVAIAFGDGSGNEERCPDVLYERPASKPAPSA